MVIKENNHLKKTNKSTHFRLCNVKIFGIRQIQALQLLAEKKTIPKQKSFKPRTKTKKKSLKRQRLYSTYLSMDIQWWLSASISPVPVTIRRGLGQYTGASILFINRILPKIEIKEGENKHQKTSIRKSEDLKELRQKNSIRSRRPT